MSTAKTRLVKMIITVKTLQQKSFKVEIEDSETVSTEYNKQAVSETDRTHSSLGVGTTDLFT